MYLTYATRRTRRHLGIRARKSDEAFYQISSLMSELRRGCALLSFDWTKLALIGDLDCGGYLKGRIHGGA